MEGRLQTPNSQAASPPHTFLIQPTHRPYDGMRLFRAGVRLLNGFESSTDRSKIEDPKKYILEGKTCHASCSLLHSHMKKPIKTVQS